jgi:hypothetical protein
LDEEIKDDRSARKKDHGQLSKRKKPSLDALEHCTRRKERQATWALKQEKEEILEKLRVAQQEKDDL